MKAQGEQLAVMAPNVKTPMASGCSGQRRDNNTQRVSNSSTAQILPNICYDPVLNSYPAKHHSYIKLNIILNLR